jgi:high-affinity nickel-transport protein
LITPIAVILLGFFLGMRHATDPDHVIAVSTIVSRQRAPRQAALIGVLWGLGHTFTIFLVGAIIILFGVVIPPRVGLTMEFSVALMLVILGVLNLTGILQWLTDTLTRGQNGAIYTHPHVDGDFVHSHSHGHAPGAHGHPEDATPQRRLDKTLGQLGFYHSLRPLVVGVVHGLAGSAAVALLVLTTIRNPRWAIAYLLVFGVGTIGGMMLITAALALPFALSQNRFSRFNNHLAWASGFVSLSFGLVLAYRIGFVDGLFSGHPHWLPH